MPTYIQGDVSLEQPTAASIAPAANRVEVRPQMRGIPDRAKQADKHVCWNTEFGTLGQQNVTNLLLTFCLISPSSQMMSWDNTLTRTNNAHAVKMCWTPDSLTGGDTLTTRLVQLWDCGVCDACHWTL